MKKRPFLGITVDNKENTAESGTYESAVRYSLAVAKAGGLPVLLPHASELAGAYLEQIDGLILTGGADPAMEPFGCETDHRARRIAPGRQAFELALLETIDRHYEEVDRDKHLPVLGVCLGMQLMALHHGASMDQYMPESMGEQAASAHIDNAEHTLVFEHNDSVLRPSEQPVVSSHRQRITDAGALRVVARAADETIEAVDDPSRPFYLGVQWHPERKDLNADDPLNLGLICKLVETAAASSR
ncbi:MAG: gamma-glutamyl-gamma-aminobutyrate hydrolase family protein [Planctomycetota bacterium]